MVKHQHFFAVSLVAEEDDKVLVAVRPEVSAKHRRDSENPLDGAGVAVRPDVSAKNHCDSAKPLDLAAHD